MTNILIGISSVFALVSYVVYAVAILRKDARPHRTTRFITLLITILATASLIAQGSAIAVWLSGIFTFGSFVIFLLSIPYGMGGWAKTDIVCLVISLLGIILWQQTANPVYALYASVGADLAGQIPMLIKTYKFPETEVWTFYFLDVLAAVCSLLALSSWSVQEYVYPLYIMFIDSVTILLILRLRMTVSIRRAMLPRG